MLNDLIRLKHMLDAAKEALSFAQGINKDVLYDDRKLTLALVKDIEIIGEAACKISYELRKKYSEIPWLDIINMRNRLIHAYFDIDLQILWDTINKDLPPLISSLNKIITEIEKVS